LSTDNPPRGEI